MYYLFVIIILMAIAFLFTNTTETFKPQQARRYHNSNYFNRRHYPKYYNRRHYRYNNNNNNNYGYNNLLLGYGLPLYYTTVDNTCDTCIDKTVNDCSMCFNCVWCFKNGSKIDTGKCVHKNDCI